MRRGRIRRRPHRSRSNRHAQGRPAGLGAHGSAAVRLDRYLAPDAVQELMGHSTIQMTMRYAHLAPQVTRDAVNLLDRPARATGDKSAYLRGSDVAAKAEIDPN